MRFAIDAMGGDLAPRAAVEGVVLAAAEYPDARFSLVGREQDIRGLGVPLPASVSVVHAADVIGPDAEPVRSVRRQKNASLVVCTRLVREGQADAAISAGNTGAFMVAGLLVVGRMRGIDRPALAATLPTFSGRGVLLVDAGANMDSTGHHLLQFARMGQAYARLAWGREKARVGLLNIGTEPNKGNELSKAAFALLAEACEDFAGNVEARDLLYDKCDVIVCDGFVGNVLVKFYEGAGVGLLGAIRGILTSSPLTKLAALPLKKGLGEFRQTFDYAEYGGGPFLGVRGVLVKAHGSSTPRAFLSVIRQAQRMHTSGLVSAMERMIGDEPEEVKRQG